MHSGIFNPLTSTVKKKKTNKISAVNVANPSKPKQCTSSNTARFKKFRSHLQYECQLN